MPLHDYLSLGSNRKSKENKVMDSSRIEQYGEAYDDWIQLPK